MVGDAAANRTAATIFLIFVAALLLYFFSLIREVVVLVFIATLIAVYLSHLTDILVRRVRVPRGLGLTLAFFLSLAAVVAVGALIIPNLVRQVRDLLGALPAYASDLDRQLVALGERYPILERATRQSDEGGVVGSMLGNTAAFLRGSMLPYLTAGGKLTIEFLSVIAMAIYLAKSPARYREGLIAVFPPRVRAIARTTVADLGITLKTWIWAQLFAMTVLGVLTWLGLWALRVPYPLAFGVFTGAVAIVPFFGTIVSTFLPALLVLTLSGPVHAVAVAALGIGVHLIEANVVAPLIFEHKLSLPPVFTIVSVLVMGTIMGAFGLLVAVPTLAVVMVVTRDVLFAEVYHDFSPDRMPAAVLVETRTGERPVIVVPPTEEHRGSQVTQSIVQ